MSLSLEGVGVKDGRPNIHGRVCVIWNGGGSVSLTMALVATISLRKNNNTVITHTERMGRGALVFKGDAPKKKSKKKKHSKKEERVTTTAAAAASVEHAILPPVVRPQAQQQQQQSQQVPTMKEGTGKITTSGTVVTGIGTRFDKELDQGDALIVVRDDKQEMRVVTMRLSNNSCAISSAFSENCKLPTSFSIIQKPRNKTKERMEKQLKAKKEQEETEQLAFGTYGTNDELVYREKTEHGSYRIQRVKVDGSTTTRGDLLQMRTQKKADKYC
jgi:preprotein translocase subunit YajC